MISCGPVRAAARLRRKVHTERADVIHPVRLTHRVSRLNSAKGGNDHPAPFANKLLLGSGR